RAARRFDRRRGVGGGRHRLPRRPRLPRGQTRGGPRDAAGDDRKPRPHGLSGLLAGTVPGETPPRSAEQTPVSPLLTLLLQIAVVIVAARAMGWVFRRLGQPQVVGEMAAGILLGPSLLGWTAPRASALL